MNILANIHTFMLQIVWNIGTTYFYSSKVSLCYSIHSKFNIIELVLITGKDASRNSTICYFMSSGENLFYYVVLPVETLIKQI